MLNKEFKYRLTTVLDICKIHYQRMQYAQDSLQNIFPVNSKSYQELSQEQISHTDQLIYFWFTSEKKVAITLCPSYP